MLPIYMTFWDGDDDTGDFEEIYKRNYGKMLWKAKSILHDEALAEDLVHDVFLRLLKNKSKFAGKKKEEIGGFCVLMVKHMSLNKLREIRHEQCMDLDEEKAELLFYRRREGAEPDILEALIEKEKAEGIRGLIDLLPEKYSIVLTMFYGFQYSCKEIAAVLGVRRHTIEMQLYRGRMMLNDILRENGYGSD